MPGNIYNMEGIKYPNLGKVIQVYRRLGNFTQEELATRSGVSVSYIVSIENEHIVNPSIHRIVDIADALNVPIGDLLTNEPVDSLRVRLDKK